MEVLAEVIHQRLRMKKPATSKSKASLIIDRGRGEVEGGENIFIHVISSICFGRLCCVSLRVVIVINTSCVISKQRVSGFVSFFRVMWSIKGIGYY
jgi:hypothetical protein